MDELVAFLRRCLNVDERSVRCLEREGLWLCTRCNGEMTSAARLDDHLFTAHGVREWGRARVLAEVQAKRAILAIHAESDFPYDPENGPGDYSWIARCQGCYEDAPCTTVRLLAQPYAGQDGWREEWRAG